MLTHKDNSVRPPPLCHQPLLVFLLFSFTPFCYTYTSSFLKPVVLKLSRASASSGDEFSSQGQDQEPASLTSSWAMPLLFPWSHSATASCFHSYHSENATTPTWNASSSVFLLTSCQNPRRDQGQPGYLLFPCSQLLPPRLTRRGQRRAQTVHWGRRRLEDIARPWVTFSFLLPHHQRGAQGHRP